MKADYSKLDRSGSDYGIVEFDIVGDTLTTIETGVALAMVQHRQFTHYAVCGDSPKQLLLLWTDTPGAIPLPFPLSTAEDATAFVVAWLKAHGQPANEGYMGGDGDYTDGARLCNHTNEIAPGVSHHYIALRVRPEYVYYGK